MAQQLCHNEQNKGHLPMLATGLYTIPEAARLAHMKPAQVRRCVLGYTAGKVSQPSLWKPEIPLPKKPTGGHCLIELGFSDLIELRFVREFLNHGVSFRTLRLCMTNAKSQLHTERPFVSQKLQTDGKTIFLKGIEQDSEAVVDLKQLQMVLKEVLKPTFLDVEYDANEAARWFPMHGSKAIVLDKNIAFGKPIAAGYGVPTETLATAAKAEGSTARVARLFDVPEEVVKEAIKFESTLS